jgi:hypothetical protein
MLFQKNNFANGMVFHFFEAGSLQNAASYKFQGSYDFSKIGISYFKGDKKWKFNTSLCMSNISFPMNQTPTHYV